MAYLQLISSRTNLDAKYTFQNILFLLILIMTFPKTLSENIILIILRNHLIKILVIIYFKF